MTPQQLILSDSVFLSCIQTDKFKTDALTLTICLPRLKEHAALRAVLPGVLRRSTEQYPDMASIHRRLDELYASCVELRGSRVGRTPTLTISAELLNESYVSDGEPIFDGVAQVVSQMLLHPRLENGLFRAPDVKQEIRFSLDAVRAEINNTRAYASIRCMELMHRNDSEYPSLKELERQLEAITPDALTDFYRKFVLSAPLHLFYVGSLAPKEVADRLRQSFSEWRATRKDSILAATVEQSAGFLSQAEKMPVAQGKLAMGFRVPCCDDGKSEDVYTAIVFNEILGGSPASKLFMNVREKMSLCYYCSSAYQRYTGILTVSAGIEAKNRSVAERAILEQLQSMARGEISDGELSAAKKSLYNAYRQIDDSAFELQGFYGNRALLGLSESAEECLLHLNAVTREQVTAMARACVCDTVFFIEPTKENGGYDENDEEECL